MNRGICKSRAARTGFTLVELVVVVLIIGILAAVAAPKMFDTAGDARQSSAKQSLSVIRDAIELYKAKEGSYPAIATFTTALRPYLKGPFPAVPIGSNQNAAIGDASSQNPIASAVSGGSGWAYNPSTGEFKINEAAYLSW